MIEIRHGDCIEQMRAMDDACVDSIVTDPPYELGFMGKGWDSTGIANSVEMWREAYRVLKPGGHLLAFSGTRTYHRMVCAIEDAGFEVRDQIGWMYGSGMPKSLDVSKAIDKAAGAEREVVGKNPNARSSGADRANGWARASMADPNAAWKAITAPATPEAQQWAGWGTALKPSYEPVCFARKPLGFEGEWVTIAQSIGCLWSRLWSLLPASAADQSSALSPVACGVDPLASAQWSAEQRSNTQAALCGQMDMSQFVSAVISSLSTVSSWNSTLAALWIDGSTSITGTKSSMTTDLKTLRCCLSAITPESIILGHRSGAWSNANACNAARYLNATVVTLNATHELSALAPAIDLELQRSLDAVDGLGWNSICVARKPLIGTVAANVLKHGTGALNIDACRVGISADDDIHGKNPHTVGTIGSGGIYGAGVATEYKVPAGRFPANVIHDGSDEVLAAFAAFGEKASGGGQRNSSSAGYGGFTGVDAAPRSREASSGTAARFFYSAKASKQDRAGSSHPTVKPISLLRHLTRLVTPPGGTVLDMFAGSGTTGQAALEEGFNAVLIEQSAEYVTDIRRRIDLARGDMGLFAAE
jgi:DNA modification methylase